MSAITAARLRRLRDQLVAARGLPAQRAAADQLADALTKAPHLVVAWSRLRDLRRYDEADQVLIRETVADARRRAATRRPQWLPDGTWRDPACTECGGQGAPCCDPPDHPPPGLRAWVRWRIVGPLRCTPETVGFWLRPYDFVADRRRWRWQSEAPCGRSWLAGLPAEQRAVLEQAVRNHLEVTDEP